MTTFHIWHKIHTYKSHYSGFCWAIGPKWSICASLCGIRVGLDLIVWWPVILKHVQNNIFQVNSSNSWEENVLLHCVSNVWPPFSSKANEELDHGKGVTGLHKMLNTGSIKSTSLRRGPSQPDELLCNCLSIKHVCKQHVWKSSFPSAYERHFMSN